MNALPRPLAAPTFTFLAFALLLSHAGRADACEPPTCVGDFQVAPRAARTIPANTPAIAFSSARVSSAGVVGADTFGGMGLVGDDGSNVPLTSDGSDSPITLVRLGRVLTAGTTYTLSGVPTCQASRTQRSFLAGPVAPLPTRTGSVRVKASVSRGTITLPGGGAACTSTADVAFVELELAASAEIGPFAETVRYRTFVDGASWAQGALGDAFDIPTHPLDWPETVPASTTNLRPAPNVLFSRCGSTAAGSGGLAAGPHEIRVVADVLGAPPLEAATVHVDLPACDGAGVAGSGAGDGEVRGNGSGASAGTEGDVGSRASSSTASGAAIANAGCQGCRVGHPDDGNASWSVPAALVALVALVRRRRDRQLFWL